MLEYIRECTIDYACNVITDKKYVIPDWDVSIEKLKAFLGLMYLQGVLHLKNFEEDRLWSKSAGLNIFHLQCSKVKAALRQKSTRSQRLVDSKFALMGEISNRFQANSQLAYTPDFSLTVDEQLFPCKSRCKYTQYVPNIVWQ